MYMFGIKYIFTLVIFCVFGQSAGLVTLPKVEENDIVKTEAVIRNTTNVIFSSLKLTNVHSNTRIKQFFLIHNFFVSLSLQDYEILKEIAKLTRVDKSDIENVTTNFIAFINDILDEENIIKLQRILKADIEIGYNIEDEVETLEILRKMREREYNKSIEINKKVLQILQQEDSIDLDVTTTKILKENEYNNENILDDVPVWDQSQLFGGRRIFGGKRTKIEHFPFMASIEIFNKFQCAGSIIKSDLVITAASCLQLAWNNRFFRENPPFLSVRVGSSFYEIGGDQIGVQEIYFNPSYNPKNLQNNIALIRLERKIKLNKKRVKKVQLDKEDHKLPKHTGKIEILGWGATTSSNKLHGPWEDKLKHAILHIYPHEECRELYNREYVTENNFCAGFLSKGTGACNRDLGGPGIISGVLTGIISFGAPNCGIPDAPTVLTKVGFYYDWIEEIMEQDIPYRKKRTTLKPSTWSLPKKNYEVPTPWTILPYSMSQTNRYTRKMTEKSPLRYKTRKNTPKLEYSTDKKIKAKDKKLFKDYIDTIFESHEKVNYLDIEMPAKQFKTTTMKHARYTYMTPAKMLISQTTTLPSTAFPSTLLLFASQPSTFLASSSVLPTTLPAISSRASQLANKKSLRTDFSNVQEMSPSANSDSLAKQINNTSNTKYLFSEPILIDSAPAKVNINLREGYKSYTLEKNYFHQKVLLPDNITSIEIELAHDNNKLNDIMEPDSEMPIEQLQNYIKQLVKATVREQEDREDELKNQILQILRNSQILKPEIIKAEELYEEVDSRIENILKDSKLQDHEKYNYIIKLITAKDDDEAGREKEIYANFLQINDNTKELEKQKALLNKKQNNINVVFTDTQVKDIEELNFPKFLRTKIELNQIQNTNFVHKSDNSTITDTNARESALNRSILQIIDINNEKDQETSIMQVLTDPTLQDENKFDFIKRLISAKLIREQQNEIFNNNGHNKIWPFLVKRDKIKTIDQLTTSVITDDFSAFPLERKYTKPPREKAWEKEYSLLSNDQYEKLNPNIIQVINQSDNEHPSDMYLFNPIESQKNIINQIDTLYHDIDDQNLNAMQLLNQKLSKEQEIISSLNNGYLVSTKNNYPNEKLQNKGHIAIPESENFHIENHNNELENNIQQVLADLKLEDETKYENIMQLIDAHSGTVNKSNSTNIPHNIIIPIESLQNQIKQLVDAGTNEKEKRDRFLHNHIIQIINNTEDQVGEKQQTDTNIRKVLSTINLQENKKEYRFLRSKPETPLSNLFTSNINESQHNVFDGKDELQNNILQVLGAEQLKDHEKQDLISRIMKEASSELQDDKNRKQYGDVKQSDSSVKTKLDNMFDYIVSFKPKIYVNSTHNPEPRPEVVQNKQINSDSADDTAFFDKILHSLSELEKYTAGTGMVLKKPLKENIALPSFVFPLLQRNTSNMQKLETEELIKTLSKILTPQEAGDGSVVQFSNSTMANGEIALSSEISSIGSNFESMTNNLQNIFSLLPQIAISQEDINHTKQIFRQRDDQIQQENMNLNIPIQRVHEDEQEYLYELMENKDLAKDKITQVLVSLLSNETTKGMKKNRNQKYNLNLIDKNAYYLPMASNSMEDKDWDNNSSTIPTAPKTNDFYSDTLSQSSLLSQENNQKDIDDHVLGALNDAEVKEQQGKINDMQLVNKNKTQNVELYKNNNIKSGIKFKKDQVFESLLHPGTIGEQKQNNIKQLTSAVDSHKENNFEKNDSAYKKEDYHISLNRSTKKNTQKINNTFSTSSPTSHPDKRENILKHLSDGFFGVVGSAVKQINQISESKLQKINFDLLNNASMSENILDSRELNEKSKEIYTKNRLPKISGGSVHSLKDRLFSVLGTDENIKSNTLFHFGSSVEVKDRDIPKLIDNMNKKERYPISQPNYGIEGEQIKEYQTTDVNEIKTLNEKQSNSISQFGNNKQEASKQWIKSPPEKSGRILKTISNGIFGLLGTIEEFKSDALRQLANPLNIQGKDNIQQLHPSTHDGEFDLTHTEETLKAASPNYNDNEIQNDFLSSNTFPSVSLEQVTETDFRGYKLLPLNISPSNPAQQENNFKKLADQFLEVLGNPELIEDEKRKAALLLANAINENEFDFTNKKNVLRNSQINDDTGPLLIGVNANDNTNKLQNDINDKNEDLGISLLNENIQEEHETIKVKSSELLDLITKQSLESPPTQERTGLVKLNNNISQKILDTTIINGEEIIQSQNIISPLALKNADTKLPSDELSYLKNLNKVTGFGRLNVSLPDNSQFNSLMQEIDQQINILQNIK